MWKEIRSTLTVCAAGVFFIAIITMAFILPIQTMTAKAATENCERYDALARRELEAANSGNMSYAHDVTAHSTRSIANSIYYQSCLSRQNQR